MAKLQFDDVPGKWHCGTDHPHVKVTCITSPGGLVVYTYVCNVQVDMDGAPDAYGPPGTRHRESLKDARDDPDPKKKGWYGVYAMTPQDAQKNSVSIDTNPKLKDANGRFPVIQTGNQPNPGFYVSQTPPNSTNSSFPKWDQRHYVDATKVAFGALSGRLGEEGFSLGDLCLSLRLDKGVRSIYPFVDIAGAKSSALSEVSYKVFEELGGSGFTQHEINQKNGFIACHLAFMDSSGSNMLSILKDLSQSDNPGDLPLMIACQLASRSNGAGLAKLRTYQNASSEQRLKTPLPHDFHAVVSGLRAAGYAYMDQGDYTVGPAGRA